MYDHNQNISFFFEFPMSDVHRIIDEADEIGYLKPVAQVAFIVTYVLLIVFGIISNIMVAYVIGHKTELRTPRNLYIINLTLSDVSMCLVCMPFTLVGLLQKNWAFGSFICKLVPIIQCTNILVSTATIVAIAGDRYFTIVWGMRHHNHTSRYYVSWSVVFIWLVSLAFSIPLFFSYYLDRVFIRDIFLYERCIESWSSPIVKMVWTITLLLIQYVIPILVLSFVHANIKRFLSKNQLTQRDPRRTIKEIERNRRTTIVLTSLALVFAISWLPWHVVNFMADFNYSGFHEPQYFYAVFGACHVIAMSTACTNPILYGWFNTNLKKELLSILSQCFAKVNCKRKRNENIESEFSLTDPMDNHKGINDQSQCAKNRPCRDPSKPTLRPISSPSPTTEKEEKKVEISISGDPEEL